MNLVRAGHEEPGKHVLHVPTLIETNQMAENEPAHVRREKPIIDDVGQAGTVFKNNYLIESVLMLRSRSQTMKIPSQGVRVP